MEKQHLIKLIENKGTSSKEETTELWDIVRTFPYFQTARLLLARSFHKQSSIHFHSELKVAAAYAADRKVLFNLIKQQPETTTQKATNANVFVLEVNQPIEPFNENPFTLPEERKEDAETPLFEIKEDVTPVAMNKTEFIKPAMEYIEEQEVKNEEPYEEHAAIPEPVDTYYAESPEMSVESDEPASSPEEIIRKRLNEILSKNKPEEAPPIRLGGESASDETSVQIPPSGGGGASLEELAAKPLDAIEGLEIETIIEENYLQELEKLPEIIPPLRQGGKNAPAKTSVPTLLLEGRAAGPMSFIDWLKQKNSQKSTLEEVIDEEIVSPVRQGGESASNESSVPNPPQAGRGALIDKFIASTPRIVPTKAEFYSPANMARLSIVDNEDIISETLARIYFDQANYAKARSCYQKLSLLYPEKTATFAPLIEKIDHLIRNQV